MTLSSDGNSELHEENVIFKMHAIPQSFSHALLLVTSKKRSEIPVKFFLAENILLRLVSIQVMAKLSANKNCVSEKQLAFGADV